MGTISFDAKFSKMRKGQDFIVYPMQESSNYISVQSDTRFGRINLDDGVVIMSKGHPNGVGFAGFQLDIIRKESISDNLPMEDLQNLRTWIKSTGGVEVGGIVKSCNIGAIGI